MIRLPDSFFQLRRLWGAAVCCAMLAPSFSLWAQSGAGVRFSAPVQDSLANSSAVEMPAGASRTEGFEREQSFQEGSAESAADAVAVNQNSSESGGAESLESLAATDNILQSGKDPAVPLWAAVVIPRSENLAQWVALALQFPQVHLTFALSPDVMEANQNLRSEILSLANSGKIGLTVTLSDPVPLPLIYNLPIAAESHGSKLVLPKSKIAWPEDVADLVAQSAIAFRRFTGETPRGFVLSGGSLNWPVAEILRKQHFKWVLAAFPKDDWSDGTWSQLAAPALDLGNEGVVQNRTFWVLNVAEQPLRWHRADEPMPVQEDLKADLQTVVWRSHAEKGVTVFLYDGLHATIPPRQWLEELSLLHDSDAKTESTSVGALVKRISGYFPVTRQITAYSWPWIVGLGSPHGPGISAWVGDARKNKAWEMLESARDQVLQYQNSGRADLKHLDILMRSIYRAESGTYFQWQGSAAAGVSSADTITSMEKEDEFKQHLYDVYRGLARPVPGYLVTARHIRADDPVTTSTELVRSPEDWVDLEKMEDALTWTRRETRSAPWKEVRVDRLSVQSGKNIAGIETVTIEVQFSRTFNQANYGIDLYVDINHRSEAGSTALLPGRSGLALASADGWEYAVQGLFSGGMNRARIVRSQMHQSVGEARMQWKDPQTLELSFSKELIGMAPLRWGYFVCLIKNGTVVDFLSSSPEKYATLQNLSGDDTISRETGAISLEPQREKIFYMLRNDPN